MKTVRRPPYPKWNPGYFPCSSLTPPSAFLTPSIGVLRWIRAKGAPITRWTKLSIPDRLSVIEDNASEFRIPILSLLGSLALVYDVGSEALHGTLYGAGISLGLFRLPHEEHADHVTTLLSIVGLSLDAMIRIGAKSIESPKVAAASAASMEAFLEVANKGNYSVNFARGVCDRASRHRFRREDQRLRIPFHLERLGCCLL